MNKVTVLPDQGPEHPTVRNLPKGTIFKYNDSDGIYIKTNRSLGIVNLESGNFWDTPLDSYNITILKNIFIKSEG